MRLIKSFHVQIFDRERGGTFRMGRRIPAVSADLAVASAKAAATMGQRSAALRVETEAVGGKVAKTDVLASFGDVPKSVLEKISSADRSRMHPKRWA